MMMAVPRSTAATSTIITKLLRSNNLLPTTNRPLCTIAADDSANAIIEKAAKYEEIRATVERAKQAVADIKTVVKHIHDPELIEGICEEFYWHPFQESGSERPYEMKEDEDYWYARVDMPGIGAKGVRVWMENNVLNFKGEEKGKENEPFNAERKYKSQLFVPPGRYQTDKITATMNNGVLKIVIPKVKVENDGKSVHSKVVY